MVLVLIAIPALFLFKRLQDRRLGSVALATAREFERSGHPGQAIRQLQHYLGSNPNDLEALSLQSRLLAETARDSGQILEAADVNDRVLRLKLRELRPGPPPLRR